MAESPIDQSSVISRAVDRTPSWLFAFCGGMVTLSVCVIAVLQLGGFSAPLQRIMNAKATEIEQAATSLTLSATRLEGVTAKLDSLDSRVTQLEKRVDKIDEYHRGHK